MAEHVTYHVLGRDTSALLDGADVFDHPVDPMWLAGFLAREGHMLVFAEAGGRVVGFASGMELLHPDSAPELFVREVGVEEDWQRQGIASELVRRLVALARARGCGDAWVLTETTNAPARGLYRSLAAAEDAEVVLYLWDENGA